MRIASVLRFCTIAARWNSSRAPERPLSRIRSLENAASPEEVARLPFADLIRSGHAQGLLRRGWPEWRRFREMRARTSHTYAADAADLVVAAIPPFLEEVAYLCAELEKRLT